MTHPAPTIGGRFLRDPETGALTRVEDLDDAAATEPAAEPAAEPTIEPAPVAPVAKKGK